MKSTKIQPPAPQEIYCNRFDNRLTYTVIYGTIFCYSVTELLHIDLMVLPFYEHDIYCV